LKKICGSITNAKKNKVFAELQDEESLIKAQKSLESSNYFRKINRNLNIIRQYLQEINDKLSREEAIETVKGRLNQADFLQSNPSENVILGVN